MKHTILFLITLVVFVNMNATAHHTIFPTLKHTKACANNVPGKTTFMQFANSANRHFSSPATFPTTMDSLFMKVDCAPLGSIDVEYWLDVNENNIIDSMDFGLGNETLTHNGEFDLDPTQGIIIMYL